MNNKKKQIIESAMKLFAKNGFHSTSMQEIADQIGIAKGSLYNQFKSKEDLLLSILDHYQSQMFERLAFVASDNSMTPKENLTKQVLIQFEGFQKNGDFIKMQVKEQLNHESEAVGNFMLGIRARILSWQKQALLHTYGDLILPNLWDIVIIFNAMMREYMMLLVFEKKDFNISAVAEFIVARIDGVISDIIQNEPAPIITSQMMNHVVDKQYENEMPSQEEKIILEIEDLKIKIESSKLDHTKKQELLSSANCLKQEIQAENPRKFLIKAFLSYLGENKEISSKTDSVKMLLDLTLGLDY